MMIRRIFLEEKGQSMVLVAVFLSVLIGFAGLAIDGGRLYLAKSQLQKAVDSGALAGANVLLDELRNGSGGSSVDFSEVVGVINDITIGNYDEGSYLYDPDQHGIKAVEVSGTESVNLMLMPVLGINTNSSVKAIARVKIGNVSKVDKGLVIPVGINFDMLKDPTDPTGTKLQYGVEMSITDSPGTGTNGYYGFLNFSSLPGVDGSNGASDLKDYILNGSPVPIYTGLAISPKNGENTGPVEDAVNEREGDIVYVPIVTGPNSDGKYVVEGFAAFELIEYVTSKEAKEAEKDGIEKESHVIVAKFLHTVIDGEIGNGGIDYGVYDAKLEL